MTYTGRYEDKDKRNSRESRKQGIQRKEVEQKERDMKEMQTEEERKSRGMSWKKVNNKMTKARERQDKRLTGKKRVTQENQAQRIQNSLVHLIVLLHKKNFLTMQQQDSSFQNSSFFCMTKTQHTSLYTG